MITKKITNSSQISEIGYDHKEKIFQVTFKTNNKTYQYLNVDESLWAEAQSAESMGKFVNAKIKSHSFKQVV